jgi:capsular polysaccharide biosynthesis protein
MMHEPAESIFRQRPIEALIHADGTQAYQIHHVHSLGPVRVEVPALGTGGNFLELWPVREWPEQGMWRQGTYESYAPPLFVLQNVLVHSSAGILCLNDVVLGESLAYAAPERHGYRALARGIALRTGGAARVRHLRGIHVSVLAGAEDDYDHALLDGLARLSAVPGNYLAAAESLLVPEGGAFQSDILAFLDLPPSIEARPVARQETLLVETLVLPLSVRGEAAYHPCILEFFRRISATVPPAGKRLPRRFVIDRRSPYRRGLLNETEVLQALVRHGFVPVRLDKMPIAEQICLFRQAEAIVATQGADLANLGFARPGCVVVELLPDCRVDWRFRNLAALARLHYDCVLGRARKPWRPLDEDSGQTVWEISVQHVVAAVAQAVGRAAQAA